MRTKVGTALGTLLTAAVIAGCGGPSESEAHDAYLKGCKQGGGNDTACECLYKALKDEGISTEELSKGLTKKVRAATEKAAGKCQSKF